MKTKTEINKTRDNINRVVSEMIDRRTNEQKKERKIFISKIRDSTKGKEIIVENCSLIV